MNVIEHFKGRNLSTVEDVREVLTYVAPPGEKREEKIKAIDALFRQTSPQGYRTSETLETYEEF